MHEMAFLNSWYSMAFNWTLVILDNEDGAGLCVGLSCFHGLKLNLSNETYLLIGTKKSKAQNE